MTVFTKTEPGDEKPKEVKPSAPEVIITDAVEQANEIIKQNARFDRQETHDEYFTRKKRSSSFGPLSIVRLTPSPLCRTPSPPRSYSPEERERRRISRHFNIAVVIALILFSFVLGFTYRAYVHSSIMKSLFRSTTDEVVVVNDATPPLSSPQKAEVRTLDGRPIAAMFVHDFNKNLTAILDVNNRRCFIKRFSHFPAFVQRHMDDLTEPEPIQPSPVVNQYYKVERRLRDRDINRMNSIVVYRHCAGRPAYMLSSRPQQQEGLRWKRSSSSEALPSPRSEHLEFVETINGAIFVDHISF
ncbi:hypothetical protein PRIPAC_74189 [Pristionchus pacificus]|uniref:Integral membrane protein 2 n=1 Tax=Pristionchus pacificus TaxID=54126 RepID=A0A2A6BFW9_PRIPA|nr:hypothetical protein PRIPAC_74189 [Pristionchus pacificus]|eukprot:PDM64779.1 hypothetical protein PRIPAC_53035 [Pristionchus pacificus]